MILRAFGRRSRTRRTGAGGEGQGGNARYGYCTPEHDDLRAEKRWNKPYLRNAAMRRPVCLAGHIGLEPADPSASYLIAAARKFGSGTQRRFGVLRVRDRRPNARRIMSAIASIKISKSRFKRR